MLGAAGTDYMSGGNGDDVILGVTGMDTLLGGGGNDRIFGGGIGLRVDGGAGNDQIEVTAGTGTVAGGAGNDVITVTDARLATSYTLIGGLGVNLLGGVWWLQILAAAAISALLLFTALWSLIVYAPIAHWVWGGGFLGGAGVLVGWTAKGDRPDFDIVTGVSTGALTAPFAFLGPDWDDELREAYTSGAASGTSAAHRPRKPNRNTSRATPIRMVGRARWSGLCSLLGS